MNLFRIFRNHNASPRLCGKLSVFFCLIREEILDRVVVSGCRVEGAEELALHIFSQAATLTAALNHLVGDLFGGGGDQIVRLQPQFRYEAVQGLFAEIPF
jgi:hypothetical protein